jgi:anaerobic selenocysteine-containing dehydrogenase
VAIDMEPESVAVAHAIICLWSITGNIDMPGGEVIARPSFGVTAYPYSSEELMALYGEEMVKKLTAKRIGADVYPMVKNFRGWAHPDIAIEQINTGIPYPIKALWIQTANVLGGQAARTRLHYEAMKKMDFIAVVDLFHNPTTMALADIVLPAATFPEKNSFRAWWAPLCVIGKRVQVGECKSDWEINFELAKRFNPDGLKKWNTVEDLFDDRMAPSGMTFNDLKERGGWVMPPDGPSKPYRRHEKGLLRQDGKPGFNTASGKVELYSKTYESWKLDPLPHYAEPAQSPVSTPDLYKKYPLIMITGARSPLFFHSEHRNIPWLREKSKDPVVEIHPETAKKLGIYDGEWVYIKNDMGKVKRKALLTLQVKPGEIQTLHGWWLPELKGTEPDLYGLWDYQINQIIPGPQFSKAGFGGGQYKTTLVTLEKMCSERK